MSFVLVEWCFVLYKFFSFILLPLEKRKKNHYTVPLLCRNSLVNHIMEPVADSGLIFFHIFYFALMGLGICPNGVSAVVQTN